VVRAMANSPSPDDGVPVELFDNMLWDDSQPMQHVLDNASSAMSEAAALHSKGKHRESFLLAIKAAVETFKAFGASREQLVPFQHLAEALEDLESGTVNPALKPESKGITRTREPTPEWSARACLAGALEARMRGDKKLQDAAREIANRINITNDNPPIDPVRAAKRLVEWRNNFLRDKSTMAAGDFQTIVLILESQKQLQPSRSNYLSYLADIEKKLLAMAAEYRDRLG
jgi:hypothetical protein